MRTMEEREEDDDNREACGDDASSSVLSQDSFLQGKLQHNKKPVGREPLSGGAASTRSPIRKHSIDEVGDRFISGRFDEEGGFSGRPLFYSSPPSSLRVEDIVLSNSRLPAPVPPFQHLVGGGVSVDLDSGQASTDSSLSDGEGTLSPDQNMSEFGGVPGILPEFIGSGSGTGIFGVPIRSAMHPDRPPALELRPHPLRETQAGCFLRTIVSSGSQLWAGLESGLRFWNLDELFECWNGKPAKRGDEESAPFYECDCTSPVLCLVADEATGFVWSGHKDGKVRSWRIPKQFLDGCLQEEACGRFGTNTVGAGFGDPGSVFREGLSWQAHRTAVLSMIITSYGDIWTGTEAGILKAWPWESIEKSLYLTIEERHMATVIVERSYVDLRSQITENGTCSLPAVDIRFLLCDHSRSTVWSAGGVTFTLWDSRKRELLKVFNIDGHVENQLDIAQTKEAQVEDEMRVRLMKKEKLGSMSFLKRSRNALMGAADVVRRVAQKGTFAEDNRRTEALVITMDGMIWTGLSNGSLVQWDGNGNRQCEVQHHFSAVMCLFAFGIHLWVGYADGTVQILDLAGFLIGGWVAHGGPIIKMDVGASYIFTLANHGGIRGWCLTSPGLIDDILRRELSNKEFVCTKMEQLEILVGTWNVGQGRASFDSLISWLGSAATDVGLVVVGLQEVEMGAGSLAIAAAKETIGLEGSANGQWWLDTIGKILDEGTSFERIGSRQLAGLLIASWVRKSIRPSVGDVDAAAIACGFGRTIGNKGAVGLRMRVFERMLCFVNCHFAAHLDAVSKRNADFDHVYRNLTFTRPSMAPNSIAAGATSVQVSHGGNSATSQNDEKPELSEADMVVFLGDFNYRLFGISYDEARDMLSQRSFDWLKEKDQLRAEMNAGRVFQGMREAQFMFPPTYKFDRHQCGLSAYDSSEKKRIPAWCDRILYRDSRPNVEAECSLECPVVSSVKLYESCMDVTDSDHKPVRCILGAEIAHIDRAMMRKQFGAIVSDHKMRSLFKEHCIVPETIVSTNNIILQSKDTSILRITNKCENNIASYRVICERQSTLKEDGCPSEICTKGSFGFPSWLQVQPAAGIIKPGHVMEVKLHHDDFETHEEFVDGVPQNWWCVDNRDKEVVLLVEVRGSYSTETREHRIHVRHCCSKKESPGDTTWSSDRPPAIQNLLQRSDFANFSSSDVMNLNHMSCP